MVLRMRRRPDPTLIALVEDAAGALGIVTRRMPTVGHDTAMFVRAGSDHQLFRRRSLTLAALNSVFGSVPGRRTSTPTRTSQRDRISLSTSRQTRAAS